MYAYTSRIKTNYISGYDPNVCFPNGVIPNFVIPNCYVCLNT